MAINSDKIIIYSIIESRLKENPPATVHVLKKHCEVEFKNLTGKMLVISEETLETDIDNLKRLLETPIKKSKITGGYYITDKEISFLSKVENSSPTYQLKFRYLFGETPNDRTYNHVGVPIQTKGWQHLMPIAKAIEERRYIQFKYRSKDGNFKEMVIIPFELICQNLHWFVVGHDKKSGEVNTFPLSNIFGGIIYQEIIPNEELPLYFLVENPSQFYPTTIDYISLEMNTKDYNEVIDHPFHPNQKLRLDDSKSLTIEFADTVSEDLVKKIMSYGNDIKIHNPAPLKRSIANKNLKSYLNYLSKMK